MKYSNYESAKMVTISTGHLSPGTINRWTKSLDRDGYILDGKTGLAIYGKEGYGFFVYLPVKYKSNSCQKDIYNNIISFAEEVNADIICFDCDGPKVEGLPFYEE